MEKEKKRAETGAEPTKGAADEIPNEETIAAFDEYEEMKSNPDKYKRYDTFKDAIKGELGR